MSVEIGIVQGSIDVFDMDKVLFSIDYVLEAFSGPSKIGDASSFKRTHAFHYVDCLGFLKSLDWIKKRKGGLLGVTSPNTLFSSESHQSN